MKRRTSQGHLVVIALALACFGPLSLSLSCAGLFYPSLSEHLNTGAGTLSYYTSIIGAAAFAAMPLLGRLLSSASARLCIGGAIALIAATFVWLSQVQTLAQFFAAAVAMGISAGVLLYLAPSVLINRWFTKRAGFFIGVVMAFTGIGGAVWSAIGGLLIESIGWSNTYLAFAAVTAATLLPCSLLISDNPEQDADGMLAEPATSEAPRAPKPHGGSARTVTFAILLVVSFALNFNMYLYFMIPSYIGSVELGATMPMLGAAAASVAMAGQTISKVTLGLAGDRFPHASAIAGTACGVVGLGLLAVGGSSMAVICVAALSFGFYYGVAYVMMPILTRHYFGTRDYARIYSRISTAAALAGATAAFAWGTLIDAAGSYLPAFAGAGLVLLVAIVLLSGLALSERRCSLSR